ncbi:DUF3693 domain-containing protein [Xanthomonas campestris pv. passiflorae]
MAERSNSEDERAAWKRIAQRLAGVSLGLLLLLGVSLPGRAETSKISDQSHLSAEHNANSLYIMRNGMEGGTGATPLDLGVDQILPADCRGGNAPVPADIHPIRRGNAPHISRNPGQVAPALMERRKNRPGVELYVDSALGCSYAALPMRFPRTQW